MNAHSIIFIKQTNQSLHIIDLDYLIDFCAFVVDFIKALLYSINLLYYHMALTAMHSLHLFLRYYFATDLQK